MSETKWIEEILKAYADADKAAGKAQEDGRQATYEEMFSIIVALDHIAYQCGYRIKRTYKGDWTMVRRN